MPDLLETFRKVLLLEQQKGYTDRAAFGGLDRFLSGWGERARAALTHPSQLRQLDQFLGTRPRYASLPPSERARWVERCLRWLERLEAGRSARPSLALPRRRTPSPARPSWPARGSTAAGVYTLSLTTPLSQLQGVSATTAARFQKLGVRTLEDLLYFFPRRHNDFSRIVPVAGLRIGEEQTVVVQVWAASEKLLGRRRSTEAILGDATGNLRAVWFNQPYLAKTLPQDAQVVLSGRVQLFRGQPVFENPEYELLESQEPIHTGRLVPVYPLTQGLWPRIVRKLVKKVVDSCASLAPDPLPPPLKTRLGLWDLPQALQQIHFPDDSDSEQRARRRLAFEELFLLQLGLLGHKRDWQERQPGVPLLTPEPVLEAFFAELPFVLTGAQRRVIREVCADLARPKPMARLLQGEVGSGKTVVATAALLVAVANGCQAALMAPTELLAEQHYRTVASLLKAAEGLGSIATAPLPGRERTLTLGLLRGALSGDEKQRLQRAIAQGELDMIIGTHALIQAGVGMPRLGLAIIDEQHRFGVLQRSALRQKGASPHLLVMSATPIPRTLALTLYGDLDLSLLDELPPGRQRIVTRWLRPEQRPRAYQFVREQVQQGRQAFIICPLVEESEAVEAKAATLEWERLRQEVFPDLAERIGLVHGRLRPAEKDQTMRRFQGGELGILVATPVVEVGIDVPNATVMLVEGADRFGLAQLHQFRGRVGRSEHPSYCLLLADSPSPEAQERLSALERTQDGLALAEEDLRLRGPGEFFGTRQSGLPGLRLARLTDLPLLEQAREEAQRLFAADPDLSQPEHRLLAQKVARLWEGGTPEAA